MQSPPMTSRSSVSRSFEVFLKLFKCKGSILHEVIQHYLTMGVLQSQRPADRLGFGAIRERYSQRLTVIQ